MKPRAEGFTNEAMAAILSSHCERNLGSVQTPVGTGDLGGPKLSFFSSFYQFYLEMLWFNFILGLIFIFFCFWV